MADGSYIHLPENARADLRAKLADIERREKEVAAEAKPLRAARAFIEKLESPKPKEQSDE